MKNTKSNVSSRVISVILVTVMLAGCFGSITFTHAAGTQYKPYYDQGFSVESNGNGSFTVRRTDKSEYTKVYYRTLPGSAIPGVHYTAKGDYLEFRAGEDAKSVQINETYAGSIAEVIDRYQVNNRTYTLEVINLFGDRLASCDRTLSYTSSYMLPKTLYGEKSVTVFSDEIKVTDSGYGQKGMPYTASIESYMSSNVNKTYFSAVGAEVRMRLDFTMKEVDDGYQHLQILFDELNNYDKQNSNGNPGTINYAAYLAAFAHKAGKEYTSYEDYTFPVTSAENNCSDVEEAWNYSPYNNGYGKLYTQKFNGNRSTDGRIVVSTDAKTLVLRFDAAGDHDDDWKVKDCVAYLQATDDNKPTVTGVYATGATYHRTNYVRLSLRFSEVVKVGSSTPVLKTNFGNLTYKGGAGTNVLYFEGTVQSENSGLAINGMTNASSITDYAGNAYSYTSITAPQNVQGTTSYTVTYNGGETESTRYQYVSSSGSAANKTITLPGGNIISGLPYYVDELDYYTTDNDTTHYKPGDTYKVDKSLTFTAHWKYKKYDITFKNDDGTELQKTQVTYGETPEYNGETPEKEPTQQFYYTFFKWTPDITRVTGNATYTAFYASHLNKYTVTFKNWDGTELQSDLLEYGSTPEYDGATPTKDADVDKTYAFSGWDKTIDTVTEDTVYTAQFTSTVRSYKITFKNEDGTVIRSGDWEYGTMPFCSAPSKNPTNTEVYAFDHWTTDPSVGSDDITFVTGDATYYAVYTSETRYYTVIFKNQDGSVLQFSSYEYGQTPVYNGETPSLEDEGNISYTFKNWNKEITPVTRDETYTAQYYVNRSGTSGGIKWSLYCDTLTISKSENQSGNMPEYERETSVPWFVNRSQIVHLIIEDGVKIIGKNAFSGLPNLKDAAIPTSVTKIGNNAFYRCSSLQSIKIPYGVTYIGTYAFYDDDSLTSVFIPGTVEYFGPFAFRSCENLESVTIADGVSEIETEAFSDCRSLKNITIPGSVERIGYSAFSCCTSLETAVIKYGVKTIDDNVFEDCCSLESVVIADSVTSIGEDVFYCCGSLISVTLPSGIDTIKPGTFYDCAALQSIVIPEGVKIIAQNAFNCCSSLSEIILPSTLETIGSGAFGNCSGSLTVYYNGSRSMWNVIYDACNSSSGLSQLSLSVIYTGTTVSTQTPDYIEAELDRYFVSGDDTNRTVTVSVKTAQGCTSYGITVTYDDENDHNQTLLLTQKSENVYTFDVPAGVDVNVMVETDSVESTVLHMGENKLYLKGRDKIYTFTPDEEGWYTFKAPDEKEIYLRVTNEDQTPLFSNFYIGEDIESYVYLAAGRTYTAEMYNNDSERGSHVGSVLIEKTSQLYKISVAAENGAIAVTSVEGLPITEAPYNASVFITPYPAEGYLYDDSNNYFGEISYGNDTTSALYNSTYYDENNVCHYTDYLFHMPASPVTVSFDFLEPSIRLVADENCIGLSINGAYYTRQQLSDLYIQPKSGINSIKPICYMDYNYASVIITKEDGTVFDGYSMPDGTLTVTVTTSPRDLILIEQLNTAYDVTAYTQYFKFIPLQDGLYNFSVTAGNFIVFTRDGKQLSHESGRIYQMLEGQIYAGYIVNGNGGTITVEKTGDYTAPELPVAIPVEGGSYTVIFDQNGGACYTAAAAPGYRFLHWVVLFDDGTTGNYLYESINIIPNDEKKSATPVFERIVYDVVFANADGTVLQHTKHYYGDMPEYNGEYPAMTTNGMTYTFTGWDGEITAVTRSKTYMATYDVTLDTVLSVGDNYVILDSDFTDYTFTPAESGWYCLSVPGSMAIKVYDGETFMTQTSMTGSNFNIYFIKDKTYTIKTKSYADSSYTGLLNIGLSVTYKLNVLCENGVVVFKSQWGDIITDAPMGARITGTVYPDSGYIYLEKRIKYIEEGYRSTTATITNNGFTIARMPACALTFKPVFERKYTITFEHDDGCYALIINGSENYYLTNEDLHALEIKSSLGLEIYPMLYNDRELYSFAVYDKDGNKLTDDNAYWFDTHDDGITIPDGICRVVVTTKKRSTSSDPFIMELAFDPDQTESFIEYTVTEPTVFSFSPAENGFYKFFLNEDTTPVQNLIYHSAMGNMMLSSSGIDELNGVNLPTDFRFGLYADQTYYLRVSSGTLKIEKVDTSDVLSSVTVENAEHGEAVYAKYSAYGSIILDLAAIPDPGYRLVRWDISKNGNVVTTRTENPAFYVSTANDNVPVTVTPVFEKVTYTVIFADENGNMLQTGEYEYGDTPVYTGKTPVKPDAANATFEFTGWEGGITAVTEDKIYKAKFKMNASDVLGVGDNYIVFDIPDNPYYYTFTPENDGWYSFSSADHIESGFEIYDGYDEIYPDTQFIYDEIYFSAYLYGGKTYTISAILFDDPCITVLTVTKDPEMHKITLSVNGNGVAAVTDYYGNTVTEAPQGAILRLKAYPEAGYYWDMYDTSYNLPYVITTGGDDYTAFYMPGSAVAVTVPFLENNREFLTVNADEGFDNLQIGFNIYTSCKDPIEISGMYYSDVTVTIKPLYTIDSVTVKDSDGNDVIYEIENSLMGTRLTFYLEKSTVINLKTSKIAYSELQLGQPTLVENDASAFTFVPEQTGLYHFEAEAGYLYVLGSDHGVNNNNGNFYLIKNQTYDVIVEDCGGKYLSVSLTEADRNPINVTSTEGGTVIYDHSDEDSIELYALPDEGYHLVRWEFRNDDGYQTYYSNDNYFVISCNPTYVNAVFAKNEYSVMFADENGFVLQKSQVQHGDVPVYSGEIPVKESSDPNVKYRFDGWSKTLSPITENTVYTVVFKEEHPVTLSAVADYGNIEITPDGDLFTGDTVTLTAEKIDDCSFLGWYNGNNKVCDTLIYKFVITEDTELTAKYGSEGRASLTVNTLNGAQFTFGDGLYYSSRTVTIGAGAQITLTAQDESKVLMWANVNGKVIGRGSSVTLTVTGNMSVTLINKADGMEQSYIQFISSSGQILSAGLYDSDSIDNLVFPDIPTKLGYTFTEWVIDGTEEKATKESLKNRLSDKTITVKAVHTQKTEEYTVTVKYSGMTKADDVYTGIRAGNGYTVTALADINGYVFKKWTNADGTADLSYGRSYFMQVLENVTLVAVYEKGALAEDTPVIAMTSIKAVAEGAVHKVTGTATRSVPDGYTLIEHGILYSKQAGLDDVSFVAGTAGVYKYVSNSDRLSGVVNLSVKTTDDGDTVYMRGYMILEKNGAKTVYYTDIVYGSYSSLTAEP